MLPEFNTSIVWEMELEDFISIYLPCYNKVMVKKEAIKQLKKKHRELTADKRKDTKSKSSQSL